MLEYYIYYAYFFIASFFRMNKLQNSVYSVLVFLPIVVLLIGRGNIGPDLPSYISIVEQCEYFDNCIEITDFGFALLIKAIKYLSFSPLAILNIIGVIQIAIICYASMLFKNKFPIFILLYVPYFAISYSFNTLRSGLAFSFITIAVINHLKSRNMRAFFLAAIGVSIHYTYIIFAALYFMSVLKIRHTILVFSLIFSLLAASYYYFDLSYYLININSNLSLDIGQLSYFSGLAPLIISYAVLVIWCRSSIKASPVFLGFLFIVVFLCYYYVSYSYSSLRMLELLLMCIITLFSIQAYDARLAKSDVIAIILISILSAIFRIRNFANDSGQAYSIAPYYWN